MNKKKSELYNINTFCDVCSKNIKCYEIKTYNPYNIYICKNCYEKIKKTIEGDDLL